MLRLPIRKHQTALPTTITKVGKPMLPEHINTRYVADHVVRIETRHTGKPHLIHDSLYRIADNANLLSGAVMTESERITTLAFIEEFKASLEGKEAIAYAREVAAAQKSSEVEDAEHLLDIHLSLLIDTL